jgi:hypothetical protein
MFFYEVLWFRKNTFKPLHYHSGSQRPKSSQKNPKISSSELNKDAVRYSQKMNGFNTYFFGSQYFADIVKHLALFLFNFFVSNPENR